MAEKPHVGFYIDHVLRKRLSAVPDGSLSPILRAFLEKLCDQYELSDRDQMVFYMAQAGRYSLDLDLKDDA